MKIFNIRQANFLIQEGCKVLYCGYGNKDNKVYLLFEANEQFKVAMKKWQKRCERRRATYACKRRLYN